MLCVILRLRRTSLCLSLPFHSDGIICLRTCLRNRGTNFSIHFKAEHDLNFIGLITEFAKSGDKPFSGSADLVESLIESDFGLHFFKHIAETASTYGASFGFWLIDLYPNNTITIQWKLYQTCHGILRQVFPYYIALMS